MADQVNICPRFWKDVKELAKHTKLRELQSRLALEEFEQCDGIVRLRSIPYIEAILNTIFNVAPLFDKISDRYDRQPFLQLGWTIWKMRYAIDNRGKSGGTRTIFCTDTMRLLFVTIKLKKDCEDERKFEVEFMPRIRDYVSF